MERLTERIGNSVVYSEFNSNNSDGCYEMMDNCLHKLAVYEVTEEIFINSKKQYIVEHRLFGTEGEWLCPSNRKVIAWQPLPQTYQPKGE